MSTAQVLDNLRSRILARYTLLFLKTWEEDRWERELSNLAFEIERGLVVWSVTGGLQPPLGPSDGNKADPLLFLEQIAAYPPDHLFLVKDFHPYLSDPRVVRKLRDLVATLAAENKTLLFIGPVSEIPTELEKEAVSVELPLPQLEELRDEFAAVLSQQRAETGRSVRFSPDEEEKLLKAVLGLTAQQARHALARGVLGRERIDDDVYAALVSEKKHILQGSDLLEFYELEEGVAHVGGLGNLKQWLAQRADAFSSRAQEQGIPTPKGVLLLGVQGCGKSLTARATARLLGFPLVRLDASNLLSSDRGATERNTRDVLSLMEAIAPAVLWLDEIEKGFAGSTEESGLDATMSRIMGRFLAWMEEHRAPVFIVATANAISSLPPELLRRGRFDEMFFIDLPNYHERKHILHIHLSKRGWKPQKYDLERLASQTEGYSGAEIEQIVISAMLESFSRGKVLSQKDLEEARDQTVPLSVTMEEKIFELREWARTRCRPATPDSRVMQVIEAEQRTGEFYEVDEDLAQEQEWMALAEHGQLKAAMTEYVRHRESATFPQLQQDFAAFVQTVGEVGLALRSDPNVVLWVGMSPQLAELVAKLITSRRLYLHQTDVKSYQADGRMLRLPLLTELPQSRWPRPAWLPVCLRDLPPTEGSGRFARVARMKLSK